MLGLAVGGLIVGRSAPELRPLTIPTWKTESGIVTTHSISRMNEILDLDMKPVSSLSLLYLYTHNFDGYKKSPKRSN